MSRADALFLQNCRDILDHGVWDTDQNVRPRWEDGTPAHTGDAPAIPYPRRRGLGCPGSFG